MSFPDMVFLSLENWDEVWRRNQFICATLARRHPKSKILFVGLPRDLSNDLKRRHFAALRRNVSRSHTQRVEASAGLPNIRVAKPIKFLPDTIAACRSINESMARRHVRAAIRRHGLRDPLLWINSHYSHHMVGQVGERGLIYDITDDWIEMDQPQNLRERIRGMDASLCKRADAVIVCSTQLRQTKLPLAADRLHLIPNGVNAAHYANIRSMPPSEWPTAARSWAKPVFGYTGTVHPDRVDVDLVEEIARTMTAGTFVFVGPDHLTSADRQRLLETGRVVLHGAVGYDVIPRYMAAFDVLIVPHRQSAFVESLQPIKLWEYLASGKPIVSTDVAGFREYPQLIRTARGAHSFASALAAAQLEPPADAATRQAIAARNGWDERVDRIESIVQTVRDFSRRNDCGADEAVEATGSNRTQSSTAGVGR